MATDFTRTGSILLSVALSCAVATSGQNSSGMSATLPGSMSSSGGSNGFGAVDSTVSANVPVVSVNAVVSNTVVNSDVSRVANKSSGGLSAGFPASSAPGVAGQSGMYSSGRPSSSAMGGRAVSGSQARAVSVPAGWKHSSSSSISSSQVLALKSSIKTNGASSSLAAKTSRTAASSRSTADEQTPQRGAAGGGGGGYATDFPDSTKNMAAINPPEASTKTLFVFEPSLPEEFPDFADYQFLRPSIHVRGPNSSSAQGQEDLYRRIQRRLTGYKQAEAPKHGPNSERRSGSGGFGNPFGSKATNSSGDKLKRRLNSGPSF